MRLTQRLLFAICAAPTMGAIAYDATTLLTAIASPISTVVATPNLGPRDLNTTETEPGSGMVGWVSPESSRRSSWDIIWVCFSVFLICSWKCTHLNIPSLEESRGEWHRFSVVSVSVAYFPKMPTLRRLFRKVGFMVLISLAPEFVVAVAAAQYFDARGDMIDANVQLGQVDANGSQRNKKPFTMSHAHWARMGGFVLRFYASPAQDAQSSTEQEATGRKENVQESPAQDDERILFLSDLIFLRDMGLVDVDDTDIQDHAKADGFTKLIAIVQAGWLVMQSIARKVAGLLITELELMTMAFVLCAFVTYLFWWDKPFDANRAIVIYCPNEKRDEVTAKLAQPLTASTGTMRAARPVGEPRHDSTHTSELSMDSVIKFLNPGEGYLLPSLALYTSGAAFSAVHLTAWNWVFPRPFLQFLWRLTCIGALCSSLAPIILLLPIGLIAIYLQDLLGSEWINDALVFIIIATDGIAILVNLVSRGTLIYLTFSCFTSMPEAVYTNLDWTKFFPHFS